MPTEKAEIVRQYAADEPKFIIQTEGWDDPSEAQIARAMVSRVLYNLPPCSRDALADDIRACGQLSDVLCAFIRADVLRAYTVKPEGHYLSLWIAGGV